MNHWYWKKRKKTQVYSSSVSFTSAVTMAMQSSSAPAQKQAALKDKGLAIEPIVGYRGYNLDEEGIIFSYNGTPWPHREPLQALCGNNIYADHDVPYEHCSCGIYAWNSAHAAETLLWGEVYLWGDVLICPSGYRAEIAYPKALHIQGKPTRVLMRIRDALAEAYGVPVTLTDPVEKRIEAPALIASGGLIAPTNLYGATGPAFPITILPTPPIAPQPPFPGTGQ